MKPSCFSLIINTVGIIAMSGTERSGVEDPCLQRLTNHYRPGRQLGLIGAFLNLRTDLKIRCPEIACRPQDRYIGWYRGRGRRIFAYSDLQRSDIVLGVFKNFVDRLGPLKLKTRQFPDWSSAHGGLVGIELIMEAHFNRMELLWVLESCCRWA
jgi:hypothetical protein